jgi:hypothetical protein
MLLNEEGSMKSYMWFPPAMVLTIGLFVGCSGGDATPTPGVTGAGAKTTDSFTPKSDELTAEEAGLVSAGESGPEARQRRPPG